MIFSCYMVNLLSDMGVVNGCLKMFLFYIYEAMSSSLVIWKSHHRVWFNRDDDAAEFV